MVECKAMELIGQYVGHSSAQVKKKMDEARGGVLFIDEAYGLDPSNSPFAKDAIEMLLANMTDPKYDGKMIIILAGYPNDIHQLIQSNPGLPRRITEQIEFKAFDANDCLDLLLEKVFNNSNNDGSKVQMPKLLHPIILDKFYELSTYNGWGNAGDVNTIFNKIEICRCDDCNQDGVTRDFYTQDDIDKSFQQLFDQRQHGQNTKNSSSRPPPRTLQPQLNTNMNSGNSNNNNNNNNTNKNSSNVNENNNHSNIKDSNQDSNINNSGVENNNENNNVQVQVENSPSDEDIWYALDQAFAELNYDIYKIRQQLISQQLSFEVINLVATKLKRNIDQVEQMLIKQCPIVLIKVQTVIDGIEKELEIQRKLIEAIARADADEIEKKRLQEAENYRRKQDIQQRLKVIGKCPMNYEWIPCGGGSYRCAGGSHCISASQLNYL